MSKWQPWLEYPDIWKGEAAFYAWLRGCLRGSIWNKSPIKISFKNGACSPPPAGYCGKAKSGAYCALSNVWTSKSYLEVDHIAGNVSLNSEEDIIGFIKHLVTSHSNLQLVTKEAHKIKSYAERAGITYEEAAIIKQAIHIEKTKSTKEIVNMLTNAGIDVKLTKNKDQRRSELVQLLKRDRYAKENKETN